MMPDKDYAGYRICDHCGAIMHDGYILGTEHACCDECAIALYYGNEEQLRNDLREEDENPGSTDCMWVDSFR